MLFPNLSNKKMNSYLEEIDVLCRTKKILHFILQDTRSQPPQRLLKVYIKTFSKVLGYTNVETTQIYAQITNAKISISM